MTQCVCGICELCHCELLIIAKRYELLSKWALSKCKLFLFLFLYFLYLLLLFDDWRRALVGYGRGDLLGVSYEESMIWHRLPEGRQQSSAAP